MNKFESFAGLAAPVPLMNIDTDMIIPKQFLKTIKRTGLGSSLFYEMRYDLDGKEKPDFILNRPPWNDAEILITGENFGCGSSREHAPWALMDFGIRCVIATSFADIFYSNCFKNGILPISLPEDAVESLMALSGVGDNARITVDLENQQVIAPDGTSHSFEIDPFKKKCLLEGLDDIALTLEKASAIDVFENDRKLTRPWL
ncbi:MAG: 3-isopropylmalate dehydratase small subunit [Rhodobacteraceae bacterium]|nr:3-isopropylmalate dehydratase small subunit [Paracoccaceae bacterium]